LRGPLSVLICIMLLCLENSQCAWAQQGGVSKKQIDNFEKFLVSVQNDTAKVDTLLGFAVDMQCIDSALKMDYYKKALDLSEKKHFLRGQARAYWGIGTLNTDCVHNFLFAIQMFDKFRTIAEQMNDIYLRSSAYQVLAGTYKDAGLYTNALDYYQKIIHLDSTGDLAIGTFANIGEVYNSLGNYPQALEYYQKTLNAINSSVISDKNNAQKYGRFQGFLLANMATVYVSMGDHDKALEQYYRELNIAEQSTDTFLQCDACKGIGETYLSKQNTDKSLEYFEKALVFTKPIVNNTSLPGYEEDILNKMAIAYLQTEKIEEANNYAQRSLELAVKLDNKTQQGSTYITLGKIVESKKDYKTAIKYFERSAAIAKETGARANEKDAWEALSNAYKQTKQFDKAYTALNNFYTLRDSIYNVDKAKQLVRIETNGQMARQRDSTNADKKIATANLQRQRVLSYGGFAGVAVFFLLAFLMFRSYNIEKKANTIITKANETIKEEKQVSESLLLNILPAHVAEELKTHGNVEAKQFDNVTVLFTDFVNFTTAGERMTPKELVAELHTCFKAFDEIIGKYNIEKIKTVGDAYLAVAGLPQANANHASDIVSAAMEIRDFMQARKQQMGDKSFAIRLGINSGSVVAGIVGAKKFAYDIWGDTVNTAARMEQNSEAMKINISRSTYELVKDKFTCTYRGEIPAKNKGTLKMYFVS